MIINSSLEELEPDPCVSTSLLESLTPSANTLQLLLHAPSLFLLLLPAVRVAEWSKAPDSRLVTLLVSQGLRLLVHVCGRGFESHL